MCLWKCFTRWKWVGIWQRWWLWDPSDLICAIVPALKGAAYPSWAVSWLGDGDGQLASSKVSSSHHLLAVTHSKRGKPGWSLFLGNFCQLLINAVQVNCIEPSKYTFCPLHWSDDNWNVLQDVAMAAGIVPRFSPWLQRSRVNWKSSGRRCTLSSFCCNKVLQYTMQWETHRTKHRLGSRTFVTEVQCQEARKECCCFQLFHFILPEDSNLMQNMSVVR